MSQNTDDPRDAALEVKLSLPKAWASNSPGLVPAVGMGLAGAVMMTRNRYLAWPTLLLGVSNYLNQKPISSKDDASALQGIVSGFLAVVITYAPMIMIRQPPSSTQTPIPTPEPLN